MEASTEGSVDATSMEACTEASMEATSMEGSVRGSFRGSFHGSRLDIGSFRGRYFDGSFRGSFRHFHGSTWKLKWKHLPWKCGKIPALLPRKLLFKLPLLPRKWVPSNFPRKLPLEVIVAPSTETSVQASTKLPLLPPKLALPER